MRTTLVILIAGFSLSFIGCGDDRRDTSGVGGIGVSGAGGIGVSGAGVSGAGGIGISGSGGGGQPLAADRESAHQQRAFLTVLNGLSGVCEGNGMAGGPWDRAIRLLVDGEPVDMLSDGIDLSRSFSFEPGSYDLELDGLFFACPDSVDRRSEYLEAGNEYLWLVWGNGEQYDFNTQFLNISGEFSGKAEERLVANLTTTVASAEFSFAPEDSPDQVIATVSVPSLSYAVVTLGTNTRYVVTVTSSSLPSPLTATASSGSTDEPPLFWHNHMATILKDNDDGTDIELTGTGGGVGF